MKSTQKIVTLCGSTKHLDLFNEVNSQESLKGHIVLSVGVGSHSMDIDMAGPEKRALDQLHFRKIDISDEVIILRKNGYMGLSTCDEYWYAIAQGKPVRFVDYKKKKSPWVGPFYKLIRADQYRRWGRNIYEISWGLSSWSMKIIRGENEVKLCGSIGESLHDIDYSYYAVSEQQYKIPPLMGLE